MPNPSARQLSWAALLVALAAFAVALSTGALGLPGKGSIDRNDLKRNTVKSKHVRDGQIRLRDLSPDVRAALAFEPQASAPGPRAFALVLGPGDVDEAVSQGIADSNISVNNGAFCIRGIGFDPRNVQVTPRSATTVPKVFLKDTTACQGGTAVNFASDLTYPEEFFIALYE
jgi:hypothetical protein